MIPTPDKRGFGHPFPAEALAHLVHPRASHRFAKPFKDCHGNVIATNGALFVRIRSYLPDDIELSDVPFEAIDMSLPWPDSDEHKGKDKPKWKPLDDDAGRVWRFGAKPIWFQCREGIEPNKLTTVRVGSTFSAPLPLIQLAARLPRCFVKIDNSNSAPLRFVWNGGEALLRPLEGLPSPSFGILTPKTDLFTKAHVFS